MTLGQLVTAVRTALGDTAPLTARWSDDDLEAHIQRAVDELSTEIPRQLRTTLTTTPGSRDLDLSTLSRLIAVQAVEWPTAKYPPEYVPFSQWGVTLTINATSAPTAADPVNVYWHAIHQVDAAASTVEPAHDQLLIAGASGFAADQAAAQNTGAISVAGPRSADQWRLFSRQQLQLFRGGLRRHGQRGALRPLQLYTPANRPTGHQTTDFGPGFLP